MKELEYWLWLINVKGMGNVKISKVLHYFKTPYQVWRATPLELRDMDMLSKEDITHLSDKNLDNTIKMMKDMEDMNIRALTIQDPEYPERLKHIHNAPYVLYVRGQMKECDKAAIAIVGSRRASTYGKKIAEKLSSDLAERGITVVSGMARGIDTSAHKGALKRGKRTLAVLGCGIDIVYPKENNELMEYIIKSGAVLSEYCPGTPPNAGYFPARNRIISGLCMGTVVIEAGKRSGSLITADFSLEQGREVFAVPGNIDNQYSQGTNHLIQQGAKLVSCVEDILEELPEYIYQSDMVNNVELSHTNSSLEHNINSKVLGLPQDEIDILNCLSDSPTYIDAICIKSGYSIAKLSAVLTLLEMKGLISQLPGKQFIRS